MANVIDIKKDKTPKKGDEIDVEVDKETIEGTINLTVTLKGDIRCWLRVNISHKDALQIVKDILNY